MNRAVDPGVDFLEVLLQTRDTGKVNNGANCAVCHTTQLKVGEFSYFSKERSAFSEKKIFLRKGTNYPIYLSELVQNLPPATQNSGSPTTTATYSANVLPAANQPIAFVVQDPQSKLGTNKPWSNFPADPSTAVATLTIPKIELTWEAAVGNTALDTNSNAGGGVRMFPDALSPDASGFRNTVIVNVKTTPPLVGRVVRLKSFDVDDPSDTAGIIDTNDLFGIPAGNDNQSTPKAGQLSQTSVTLDSLGTAFVVLTSVPTKPGDNLRVAAVLDTPGAQAHLDGLQVTNDVEKFFVTPDSQQVIGFVGGISPMLTVWRKLHLEFDSMTAPPATGSETLFVNGKILGIQPNFPSIGKSFVRLLHTNLAQVVSQYHFDKIMIPGYPGYRVSNSRLSVSGNHAYTSITVDAALGTNVVGLSVTLYDDDERYFQNDPLSPSVLNMSSPPLPADTRSGEFVANMQSAFSRAYIQLVDARAIGLNVNPLIQFKRTAGISPFDIGTFQLKGADKPEFWAYSVGLGYEPEQYEDGDPDSEEPSLGVNTDDYVFTTSKGFCIVYFEAVRDKEWSTNRSYVTGSGFTNPQIAASYQNGYLDRLYGAMIHEIGHAPGGSLLDHFEGGLMQNGASKPSTDAFTAKTIRRFRLANKWTP